MSSCSWSDAALPIRTGRDPRYPSRWSNVRSVRSDPPAIVYTVRRFSGRQDSKRWTSQSMNEPDSEVMPSRVRAYSVKDASRIHEYR